MDGKTPAPQNAQPLGVITKDDVVIRNNTAVLIVAGEARLYPDGTIEGSFESYDILTESLYDLLDDGARIFEVSQDFIGRWR